MRKATLAQFSGDSVRSSSFILSNHVNTVLDELVNASLRPCREVAICPPEHHEAPKHRIHRIHRVAIIGLGLTGLSRLLLLLLLCLHVELLLPRGLPSVRSVRQMR